MTDEVNLHRPLCGPIVTVRLVFCRADGVKLHRPLCGSVVAVRLVIKSSVRLNRTTSEDGVL